MAEFRKGSARGPTTVRRFVKDFLLSPFKGLFETIYVDSEYTGKDVWNFILDQEDGMGSEITACIKQNAFVKKQRDKFLFENRDDEDFWIYYDDKHVYSSKSFPLSWNYKCKKSQEVKTFTLYCVVKRNIRDGKLRCFGTSRKNQTSYQILRDYSHRWTIESGVKDLIISYYLSNCPGTKPHNVNVHFFNVSVCKQLYRMIERDLGDFAKNYDRSVKTLQTMRDVLFKPGSAEVSLNQNTFEIRHLNNYSPKLTEQLRTLYDKIHEKTSNGLTILGGLKMKYVLNPPLGQEHKNGMKKIPLSSVKNFSVPGKID